MANQEQISGLETHAGYWLRFVSNHVSHAFRMKVERHGVTVAEWVVLRELLRLGETNPATLAEALGMTRGAVSKLVDRLEAKKLIRRKQNPEDRRFQSVQLRSAGRRLLPLLAALADQNDQEFFGHLSDRQRSELVELLKGIVERHELKTIPVE